MDLSIIMPARNEEFLGRTIENILTNIGGDTEIIAICDGNWPDPPVNDHSRVTLIYHSEPIGQRAAVNEGVRLSQAKYVMKADAHCAFDEHFDLKLMADCEYDWTVVPRMYNLYGFDWVCKACGQRWYQSPSPTECKDEKCSNTTEFERDIKWEPWKGPRDSMRFDRDMKFAYWGAFTKRSEGEGDITPTLSFIGACWFMHRERYWELDGLDEDHGFWGQVGTEVACKSWLSGGKLMVNKKTWFSHLFRTQGGDFGFPYKLRNRDIDRARKYSQDLWLNDKWSKAKYPLSWLIEKFKPVPDWHDDKGNILVEAVATPTKGIVYYTDNSCQERIANLARDRLNQACNGFEIVSVSHYPLDFGQNIVMQLPRSSVTMFKQILVGLEASKAEIVYLVEHDVLYHPSHFEFVPPREDTLYYNKHRYAVDAKTGQALHRYSMSPSHLVAYRSLLVKYYQDLLRLIDERGYSRRKMGFAPGGRNIEGMDTPEAETYTSELPNVDIRNIGNFTTSHDFRERGLKDGELADEIPFWGKTKDRFDEFIMELSK